MEIHMFDRIDQRESIKEAQLLLYEHWVTRGHFSTFGKPEQSLHYQAWAQAKVSVLGPESYA